METLGVSMIIPLVSALAAPDTLMKNEYVNKFVKLLGIYDIKTLVIVILIVFGLIYLTKNAYLLFLYYMQYKFIYNNILITQEKQLNAYLKRPYTFFLNTNFAEINRAIYSDVLNAYGTLQQFLTLFSELAVCGALAITLFIVDWKITGLIVMLLGGIMFIIKNIQKPITAKVGRDTRTNQAEMSKWILQAVYGIKELKVTQREAQFISNFKFYGSRYVKDQRKYNLLGQTPKLLIETTCIIGIVIYLIILILSGADMSRMLPQLSAFAMAVVRLMPSANKISVCINSITYFEASLKQISDDANNFESDTIVLHSHGIPKNKMVLRDKIEMKDVCFSYSSNSEEILHKANMIIPIGKSVGIIGESGAGKSTLIDILLGLLPIQNGDILADRNSIFDDYSGWVGNIGYIPQMIYMLDDTIKVNVAYGIPDSEIDEDRLWLVLEEARIADFVRKLPEGVDSMIGERGVRISGGQRQRLGIARALYSNPDILVFDEATSALDTETEESIMESIETLHGKKTLIIIAHRLATIRDCDFIYRVENKTIIPVDKKTLYID